MTSFSVRIVALLCLAAALLAVPVLVGCDASGGEPAKPTVERPTAGRPSVTAPTPGGPRPTRPPAPATPRGGTAIPRPSVTIPSGGGTPVSNYDAEQAIESYASQVLGISVQVVRAGGWQGTVTLPGSAQESVNAAVTMAGVTYLGTMKDGIASVSLGDGTISGDLETDISGASLGAFVLVRKGDMPADEGAALALIKSTYPGVATMSYTAEPTETGYLFYATATVPGIDPRTRQATMVGRAVLAGVEPGGSGQVTIWVVVGNGTFTTALQ